MEKQTIYLLLFVFVTFSVSCSKDDEESLELVCGKYIANYSGTICCITGSELVNPGESLSFEYNSNIVNPVFAWEVISGSISIVSGQNTSTVTLEFGKDFTTGEILGKGDGNEICTESLTINKR
jgi:hypothetical protein|tara:strand:- start:1045 stop:1416 length:372 start_codon:yes stop_codon:yes gene_type:complete